MLTQSESKSDSIYVVTCWYNNLSIERLDEACWHVLMKCFYLYRLLRERSSYLSAEHHNQLIPQSLWRLWCQIWASTNQLAFVLKPIWWTICAFQPMDNILNKEVFHSMFPSFVSRLFVAQCSSSAAGRSTYWFGMFLRKKYIHISSSS